MLVRSVAPNSWSTTTIRASWTRTCRSWLRCSRPATPWCRSVRAGLRNSAIVCATVGLSPASSPLSPSARLPRSIVTAPSSARNARSRSPVSDTVRGATCSSSRRPSESVASASSTRAPGAPERLITCTSRSRSSSPWSAPSRKPARRARPRRYAAGSAHPPGTPPPRSGAPANRSGAALATAARPAPPRRARRARCRPGRGGGTSAAAARAKWPSARPGCPSVDACRLLRTPWPPMMNATVWPQPADPDAAVRLIERFAEKGEQEADLAGSPAGRAMLQALGGGSPFLSDLSLREHRTVLEVMQAGPDQAVAEVHSALEALARRAHTFAARCRPAPGQAARRTDHGDGGYQRHMAARPRHVRIVLARRDDAPPRRRPSAARRPPGARTPAARPGQPRSGSGFVVLGMGKLGARELNYSSDIDLVLLYDPDAHPDRDGVRAVFTRLARNLVAIMEARDADGYVFRTDLRLRPDPAATPPAVALPAALAYYESMGQNWERAAMTKARPVAGDDALGRDFLDQIRPFVWRRGPRLRRHRRHPLDEAPHQRASRPRRRHDRSCRARRQSRPGRHP